MYVHTFLILTPSAIEYLHYKLGGIVNFSVGILAYIIFFLYLCSRVRQNPTMRKIHYIILVILLSVAEVLFVAVRHASRPAPKQLSVLCIGNSFSIDAVENNLVELAAERGIDLVVGNLYIGGCSLERHALNIRRDSAAYSFRLMQKRQDGDSLAFERIVTDSMSIHRALAISEWDVITMQQASHYSGQWFTYEPYLTELIDSVRLHISPDTKLYWYMTWAYQQDATHPAFKPNYNGDQTYMYSEILGCNRQVLNSHSFDGFIPGGVAVQAARRTWLGDTLCRDGYHLSYTCGRYLMACLWLEVLTGKSALGCKYVPEGMSPAERRITQQVAHYVAQNGAKQLDNKRNPLTP